MRIVPPVNIDDLIALSVDAEIVPSVSEAMLTSCTVPETAPAAYAGGTTYAMGDQASVATGLVLDIYESLQSANTGHAPASSPTWWRHLGATYAAWNSGTSYAVDDVVLDAANHLEYVSLVPSNLNNNPATDDGLKWFTQPSNRWRALDLKRNTKTTAPSPVTYTFTPGSRIDSMVLTGLVADSVRITSTVAGETVYSETIDLDDRNTVTWSGYFFNAFAFKSSAARIDLPLYSSAVVSVTLERASGDVSVGGILPGRSVYIGRTLHDAQNGAENFSTIERNAFGDTTLIRRRMAPKFNIQVRCDKANVPNVIRAREKLNAIPAGYLGIDDEASGYFEPLLLLGVNTGCTVTMDQPNEALVELEVKEV